MLERITATFNTYPDVYKLMRELVSMQLEDVGGMLRLPIFRPNAKLEIKNGCNFAATAVLCNIVSGVAVTVFQPKKTTKTSDEGKVRWVDSDKPFKELLASFFPWPAGVDEGIKKEAGQTLYNICRTSFAHSLGIHGDSSFSMKIVRHRPDQGLTADEVQEIEESVVRPGWLQPALNGANKDWELVADGLYRDVLDMLCKLGGNDDQMKAAQKRFEAGKFIWRSGEPPGTSETRS